MAEVETEVRNAAKRLLVTVSEMLAPVSTNPSPQRLKLDGVMRDLELAVLEFDRSRALDRLQQLGQEMDNG